MNAGKRNSSIHAKRKVEGFAGFLMALGRSCRNCRPKGDLKVSTGRDPVGGEISALARLVKSPGIAFLPDARGVNSIADIG